MSASEITSGIKRSLVNNRYEKMPGGEILIPEQNITIGGVFDYEHYRGGQLISSGQSHNKVVNEGLDHLLSVGFNDGTKIPAWYIGIYTGTYTPIAGEVAANIAANAVETSSYTETTRPVWNEAAPSGQSITNTASRSIYTMSADQTVLGAFLISSSQKGGAAGLLMSVSNFPAARILKSGDVFLVGYSINIASA